MKKIFRRFSQNTGWNLSQLWQARLLLAALEVLQLAGVWRFWQYFQQRSIDDPAGRVPLAYLGVGLGISGLAILVLGLFVATWLVRPGGWQGLEQRSLALLAKMHTGSRPNLRRIMFSVLFGLAIGLFSWLVLGVDTWITSGNIVRWILYGWLVLAGAVFVKASGVKKSIRWMEAVAAALLISGAGYLAATFLNGVSQYPFSLDWSEASRYWYASLYLPERLYGFRIPPSVLHPTRYLMQAVPFLINDSPLWLHRLWQALLWIGVTLGAAIVLARRLAIAERFRAVLLVCFTFLFLLAGPVYYHLVVPLILVLGGFNYKRPWKSLLVVLVASVWTGLSRLNWVPVPGLMAAMLYFLEKPVSQRLRFVVVGRYLCWPAIWVFTGTGLAYLAQTAYENYSGNPVEYFRSSFSSQLLWYRLLPNATYKLGILLNSIWFFLPLFVMVILILWASWRKRKRLPAGDALRWLGIFGILAVLFAGGILVSVKIGGGSNLHNLDAFLALFLVAGCYAYFGRVAPDEMAGDENGSFDYHPPAIVLAAVVLVPVIFAISTGSYNALPPEDLVATSLSVIQKAVNKAPQFASQLALAANSEAGASSPAQVLFITERQLLTFKAIQGTAAVIPDYEKVFLMEMAMANNKPYLETFYRQIKAQKFALIVSESLKVIYQDRSYAFNEENNAWVKRVVVPILCYYEPYDTLKKVRVQLLIPRQKVGIKYLGEGRPANCP